VSAEVRETARRLGTIVRHLVVYNDGGESLRAIDSHGLTFVQFKVLMELFVSEPGAAPYLQELAESLGASTPSLSRAVDGLVRKGLATRQEDREDRRRRRIALTEAGRDVVDRFYLSRVARVIEFASSLTPEQREAFARATDELFERDDLAPIYDSLEGTIR
jgi:DNA-binding MarR family transcriptional regulator